MSQSPVSDGVGTGPGVPVSARDNVRSTLAPLRRELFTSTRTLPPGPTRASRDLPQGRRRWRRDSLTCCACSAPSGPLSSSGYQTTEARLALIQVSTMYPSLTSPTHANRACARGARVPGTQNSRPSWRRSTPRKSNCTLVAGRFPTFASTNTSQVSSGPATVPRRSTVNETLSGLRCRSRTSRTKPPAPIAANAVVMSHPQNPCHHSMLLTVALGLRWTDRTGSRLV